jgi:flagellar hook-associated protein 1
MSGLFGTLNLSARSLQTQQQGVSVAGHNLANVNNQAYARQRLVIAASPGVASAAGYVGAGADGVTVQRLRNALLDRQIVGETSVGSSLRAQQQALQQAQAHLGAVLDGQSGVTSSAGLAGNLQDLFNSFQSLSANPASLAERQNVTNSAQQLASRLNEVDRGLASVHADLDSQLTSGASEANGLLQDIANLNHNILQAEATGSGVANDLRDTRQAKVEQLAQLMKVDAVENDDGTLDLSAGGLSLVAGDAQVDRLETYDAGGGQLLLRGAVSGSPLALTSGSLQGTIEVRDGALASLRGDINNLAAQLISQVNAAHAGGYDLHGNTGQAFFTGTNASDIAVNATLLGDPEAVQASGTAGNTGDNQVALALSRLSDAGIAGLNGQSFGQHFALTVASLGEQLSSLDSQTADQQVVDNMLQQQRDSISGVSMDEEMTDLTRYQKAFAASAKLVSTVDEMLNTLINMKQ